MGANIASPLIHRYLLSVRARVLLGGPCCWAGHVLGGGTGSCQRPAPWKGTEGLLLWALSTCGEGASGREVCSEDDWPKVPSTG